MTTLDDIHQVRLASVVDIFTGEEQTWLDLRDQNGERIAKTPVQIVRCENDGITIELVAKNMRAVASRDPKQVPQSPLAHVIGSVPMGQHIPTYAEMRGRGTLPEEQRHLTSKSRVGRSADPEIAKRNREMAKLRYEDKVSVRDIAIRYGMSEATVYLATRKVRKSNGEA